MCLWDLRSHHSVHAGRVRSLHHCKRPCRDVQQHPRQLHSAQSVYQPPRVNPYFLKYLLRGFGMFCTFG